MRETGRQTVHHNPWYSVVRTDFETADGGRRQYFSVVKLDSVLVIARHGDACVFVEVDRPTFPGLRGLEFPQGAIEPGESPRAAAHRELREETGWLVGDLTSLGSFTNASGFSTCSTHVFVGEVSEHGDHDREDFEQGHVVVELTSDQVRRAVHERQIFDGPTLAALTLLRTVAG